MKNYRNLKRLAPIILALLVCVLLPQEGFSESATGKIAVLPWKVNSAEKMDYLGGALLDMFTSRIGSGKGLEVTRADILKGALKGYGAEELTETVARKVGKALGLNYVLYGSVTVLGDSISLDARLLDVKAGKVTPFFSRGTGVDSIIGLADNLSKEVLHFLNPSAAPAPAGVKTPETPAPGEPAVPVSPPPSAPTPAVVPEAKPEEVKRERPPVRREAAKPGMPEFWKSGTLKGEFISLAAADLDGNGVKELFLLKKTSLTIAEIKEGKLGVKKTLTRRAGTEFVSVSAVDSDNDGVMEVYVSALRNFKPVSFLVEFKDGDYKVTTKAIPWLLRAMRVEGRTILVGQKFRDPDGFYGTLKVLKKSGSELKASGAFPEKLPRGIDLYRFALFNFNSKIKDEVDLVALDGKGRVRVYKKDKKGRWKKYWKSKEIYGGTLNRVEFTKDTSGAETYRYLDIKGKFFHIDTNGDGVDELIIKSNKPGGPLKGFAKIVRSYSGGAVMSLSWDGEFLTGDWKTREVNGYIADFLYDDLTGDSAPQAVMVVVEGTGIMSTSPKSYVIIYRPGT